jgi:biopolymer transport protein ExbD
MFRSKPGGDSKVQLPVTPFLDMTFQLLFFFMASFNPADQEGQIDMALPANGGVNGPVAPPVGPPDCQADVTVLVRSRLDGINDGEISALFVRDDLGREEPIEGGLNALRDFLARKRGGPAGKEAVKVEADASLRVRNLSKVMDACRQAGFKNVGLVEPPGAVP